MDIRDLGFRRRFESVRRCIADFPPSTDRCNQSLGPEMTKNHCRIAKNIPRQKE